MARGYDLPLALEFSDPSLASARLPLSDGFPLFNAGVMAFSVPYLREIDALGRCQALAREFGWEFFLNPDQGMWITIAYLTGGFGRLPPEYNFMTWSDMAPAKGKNHDLLYRSPHRCWYFRTRSCIALGGGRKTLAFRQTQLLSGETGSSFRGLLSAV